jgi:hypothetical protein
MNSRIDQLVKTLLQKESINDCSVSELRQFADRHPYFGAAQLLLTKKLQQEKDDGYSEQLQKTFSFFHNPLWVEHLLTDNGKAVEKEEETVSEEEEQQPQPVQPITAAPPVELAAETVRAPATAQPPLDKKEDVLVFEPYHTVDYFASQGIRFREEEKPVDKFGRQLKSFTEWLKTMKRLPAGETNTQLTSGTVAEVDQMAETSLKERDIVTEAMAEVWEKQGNITKAIDIYGKLSLLDPSKSAYFAAKIAALKHN